ncbi:Autophagy protein 7 [Coemansia thaxteri]|nr:Autophagy protein 7 [Coemansia thaxteri]
MAEVLRFEPFSSAVEPEFWAGLAHHKLHTAQLDTASTAVQGEYGCGRRHAVRGGVSAGEGEGAAGQTAAGQTAAGQTVAVPARLRVGRWAGYGGEGESDEGPSDEGPSDEGPNGGGASDKESKASERDEGADGGGSRIPVVTVTGSILNTNTAEEFKRLDKGALLRRAGADVMEAIQSGRAAEQPALLWPFVVVAFADLKRYRFWHWFGFPAVMADPADGVAEAARAVGSVVGSDGELESLVDACAQVSGLGAFLVERSAGGGAWRAWRLADWGEAAAGGGEVLLAFVDPSSHATRPGWPLRNVLAWVRHRQPAARRVRVLCFRDAALRGVRGAELRRRSQSIVVGVAVAPAAPGAALLVGGWERDERQRAAPRVADLGSAMDPARLAGAALELNLQLMRWRVAPGVDVARMAAQRVLLVGAGTLGAYAARALLAWGVRTVTFVDSGRVALSNPARQPLYDFADSLGGGRPKAAAAAAAMRRIFPAADAHAEQLQVPMPGHPVPPPEEPATRAAAARLDALVAAHDAVFLLTDSRESRWLPAMLGALHRKVVLCVALGFDSFVAMRHGVRKDDGSSLPRLGCYFCNDIVAPADSLSDRTLDQQCTVTRPGLAPIAAGTAVELLATIVQHPLRGLAPPPPPHPSESDSDSESSSAPVFGAPPHQIRGYLPGFRQHAIVGHAYAQCTACSDVVLDAYRQHGFDFLLRVFNNTVVAEDAPHTPLDPALSPPPPPGYSYLEALTGLAALHRQTDDIMADIELSDDGSDAGFEPL